MRVHLPRSVLCRRILEVRGASLCGHRSRRRNRCFFLFSFQHVEAHLSFLQNLLALGLLQLVSGLRLSWETPRCRLQTESAFLDQIDFVFDRLEVVLALA